MEFITHIIKDGQRLDSIAYQYWGDTNLAPLLVLDNPHISIEEELIPGEEIFVRDETDDENLQNTMNLPPWRI